MNTATVSPKFPVVIPRGRRRLPDIQAGRKLKTRIQNDRIELIPGRTMTAARGFLAGIDTQLSAMPIVKTHWARTVLMFVLCAPGANPNPSFHGTFAKRRAGR